MRRTTLKFKVGDKVKILPSAVDGGVSMGRVDKTGVIIKDDSWSSYFLVKMDELRGNSCEKDVWAVYSNQMTLAMIKGQQLLFSFME